jgi:hypothetical protein
LKPKALQICISKTFVPMAASSTVKIEQKDSSSVTGWFWKNFPKLQISNGDLLNETRRVLFKNRFYNTLSLRR